MSHTNAYIWFWLNDNAWIPYDSKLIPDFEKSYNSTLIVAGNKKIGIDKERYIELMPINDILSNFVNQTADPDFIGIQRRYDDPLKRRIVKRSKANSTSFFDDHEFAFYSSTSQKTKTAEIKSTIKMCGGKVVDSFSKKTDYLIFKPSDHKDDIKSFNDIVSKAEGLKVVCVESTWIDSCIKSKKLVDSTAFLVTQKIAPTVVATATTATTTTATKPTTTKKTTTKITTTATTTPNPAFLIKGSEWTGVCSSGDDHFPFIMTVDNVVADELSGVITWINLGCAKTKYKGKLNETNGEFNFQEYEIITGEDEVEVPNDYTSTVLGDKIVGKVGDSTFKLTLTKSPPVENLQPDSQWKGTSTLIEQFKLKVVKRDAANINGTLTWPNFDDATGTFAGVISSTHIHVTDYKEGKKLGPEELVAPFNIIPTQQSDHSIKFTIETIPQK